MIERCGLPTDERDCQRVVGHAGPCRPNWAALVRCGAPMRYAKEPCARRTGHRDDHRSQYALDYDRDRMNL